MKRSNIIRLLACAAMISSMALAGFGCKKEEPKVEKAPEASTVQTTQGQVTVANASLPKEGFKAEITVNNPPATLKVNAKVAVNVKVKNASNVAWSAQGQPDAKFKTHLAYHWLTKDGKMFINDGLRTVLTSDLVPGNEINLSAGIVAPNKPGDYILEFDMVQEGVSWFGSMGSPTAKVNVTVN